MNKADWEYVSQSVIEVFDQIGYCPAHYFSQEDELERDERGKLQRAYKAGVRVSALFSSDDYTDPDINQDTARMNSGRVNGYIKVVAKQLLDAGIIPKLNDAIDIADVFGRTTRYIIMGEAQGNESRDIGIKFRVTSAEKSGGGGE